MMDSYVLHLPDVLLELFYFRFVDVQMFWNFHLPDVLLELVAEGPQLGHVCLQPLLLFLHLNTCK